MVITALALAPVCRNEFVEWDDSQTISANPNFNPPTFRGLANHWTSSHQALYVPITYTVWWLIAQIAQTQSPEGMLLNPWIFHTANLLIHLCSVTIVFQILRRFSFAPVAAFFGALIFAVHPVQVEAVAWASGTKDVLSGMLSLLAILWYLQSDEHRWKRYGSFAVLVIAFFAKPSAVVVPAMLVVIQWLWRGRTFKQAITEFSPWLLAIIPAVLFTAIIQPTIHSQTTPLWARPLVAMDAIAFYVFKLIAPVHLALDYGRTPARIMETGAIWWTWIIPMMLILLAWRWRQRGIAVVLLFVVALAPVLGLLNFTFQSYSTVADHYLYLPMLAVAMLAAWIVGNGNFRRLLILPPLLIVLAVLSFLQATTWQDTRSVFSQVLRVNNRSALAYTNLATVEIKEKNDASAEALLQRAVALNPDYGPARLNLAMLHIRQGEKDLARRHFEELLRIYRSQRNADPKLIAQVRQLIDKLTAQ